MPDLQSIDVLVRLATGDSFTRIAADLGVQQGTVSRWLQKLEAELDVQLVARTTRTTRLTEDGLALLPHAQALLDQHEALLQHAQSELPGRSGRRHQLRGRLRLSMPVVFGRRILLPALLSFQRQHPDLDVDLVFDDRAVDIVHDGFDAAVRVGPMRDSSWRLRRLATVERWLVAAPTYVSSRPPIQHPSDVERVDVLHHAHHEPRQVWAFHASDSTEPSVQVRFRPKWTANLSDALQLWAEHGEGVALLAAPLVRAAVDDGRLCRLLPEWSASPAHVQLLMPPTLHPSAKMRLLVDHLVEHVPPLL